jgi:nitrite reductase/ring-hydroxylating ferredoxin subunit
MRVYEHTRITEVQDGKPVEAKTDGGFTIRAGAVFCATHVPLNTLLVQSKLAHYQSYAVAFAETPMADGLFWDTADPYHYIRGATIDGREYLIVGGEDHKTGEESNTGKPSFRWSGQVVESIDGLPYIGRNAASKNVYIATGFGGNGITYGTIAALIVSDTIRGMRNVYAPLYQATRVNPHAVGAFLTENRGIPRHLIGDRLLPAEAKSTAEVGYDEARLMKLDGKRVGVYRDGEGRLHAVSATCPHMGCIVHFNDAERTWDCPCHGSRFNVDGKVLDGPAVQPLAAHRIEHDVCAPSRRTVVRHNGRSENVELGEAGALR